MNASSGEGDRNIDCCLHGYGVVLAPTATPESLNSTCTSTQSNSLGIGLGVGLGIGLPLLGVALFFLFCQLTRMRLPKLHQQELTNETQQYAAVDTLAKKDNNETEWKSELPTLSDPQPVELPGAN